MKKFILGKKIGMTQVFDKEGKVIPVTLIEAGPCFVAQIKTIEKDGYNAVQIGFGAKKKISKPLKGHLKELSLSAGQAGNLQYLKEFENDENLKVGDKIDVSVFKEEEKVRIAGISKGKGFAGVVKRHGFAGGPASHGNKDRLRAPGSIGMSFPERVPKGRRMAGRMGGERTTVKNLKIVGIDLEKNILAVKGAVSGPKGSLVEIVGM